MRQGVNEDLYELGLVFIELVVSSFSDDFIGAQVARSRMAVARRKQKDGGEGMWSAGEGVDSNDMGLLETSPYDQQSQLTSNEWRVIFEQLCDSDFQTLRTFTTSIGAWKDATSMLEDNNGASWRLIFKLVCHT